MKIVIQGAGEVGSHLAKMLSLEANDITVIDDDPQRLANISSIADVIAIEGAPSSLRVMREAGRAERRPVHLRRAFRAAGCESCERTSGQKSRSQESYCQNR